MPFCSLPGRAMNIRRGGRTPSCSCAKKTSWRWWIRISQATCWEGEMAMRTTEETDVGRFFVEVELANYEDMAAARRGILASEKVRRLRIQGLVDPGASRLVLPQTVVKKLGLESTTKVKVRYANGRTAERPLVEGVYLELMGRHS